MRFFLLLTTLLLGRLLSAQTVEVASNLDGPSALEFVRNVLYFTQTTGGKLSKIDFGEPTPTVVDLLTGLEGPYGLAHHNGYLYFAESSGGRIRRIALDEPSPSPELVLDNLTFPNSLAISAEGILYFAQFLVGDVVQLDLNDPQAQARTLVLGLQDPAGLAIVGDTLFIADTSSGLLGKVDRSRVDPAVDVVARGLPGINHLRAGADGVYLGIFSGNEVLHYNQLTGGLTRVLDGITEPTGLDIFTGQLFVSVFGENKIVRLDLTVGTSAVATAPWQIYPNPAQDILRLNGLEHPQRIQLLDAAGRLVREIDLAGLTPTIDISYLPAGIYYLRTKKGALRRFVKSASR